MICTKHSKHGMLIIASVCSILLASQGPSVDRHIQSVQQQKEARFVLDSSVVEETFGLVTQQIKGRMSWLLKDEKDFVLQLEVTEIKREFQDANDKSVAIKHQAFAGIVSTVKEPNVPISIEISKGKLTDNPIGLSTQYRTVYLILEMMLATVLDWDFTTAKGDHRTVLSITFPDSVKTGDFGVIDASRLRASVSPTKFIVFPRIQNKMVKGSELVSFAHDKLTISYFYRFLDKSAGLATHAVNLEVAVKKKTNKVDYTDAIAILDDPNQFASYNLHELTITNIK